MPKIDIASLPVREGSSGYPKEFRKLAGLRRKWALGDGGLPPGEELEDFGVNLVDLPPGAWSSQRHWHSEEDEFVYVLEGELTLVTDRGEELLKAGDAAVFSKRDEDAHHLINKSGTPARFLEVGGRSDGDATFYPDIDLHKRPDNVGGDFTRKDGTPYEDNQDD